MNAKDELQELAEELAGAGWRGKLHIAWTPEEQAEYQRVGELARRGDEEARRELERWLLWLLNEPVTVSYDHESGMIRLRYKGALVSEYRATADELDATRGGEG